MTHIHLPDKQRADARRGAVMEDRKYAKSHEWVKVDGDIATIGISEFAQVCSLRCTATWCLHTQLRAWVAIVGAQERLPHVSPVSMMSSQHCMPHRQMRHHSGNVIATLAAAGGIMHT